MNDNLEFETWFEKYCDTINVHPNILPIKDMHSAFYAGRNCSIQEIANLEAEIDTLEYELILRKTD